MFYAHALRDKRGIPVTRAHITLTTFTMFDQNCSVGCLLALYGCTMHPARLCGGFRTIFFLLSVHSSLKKKNNNNNLSDLESKYYWEYFQKHFVLVPADKASNNVLVVCKNITSILCFKSSN